ncbi:MAG: hypothetical protein GF341_00800, partial [candidate division Zixibacteria bacterium]|nr:hypothetical protein [candidate division Zixibacteria bacterium]
MNHHQTSVSVSLSAACDNPEQIVGGKAWNLAKLLHLGYPVPPGLVLTTAAYQDFAAANRLPEFIAMEIGRKPLHEMRWEELWDAALRIRSAFAKGPLPESIRSVLSDVVNEFGHARQLIVRSSAPGEDSAGRSFAGLHESLVADPDVMSLSNAVRSVWASLWSDAALLYRSELSLDPHASRMAVLIQEFNVQSPSGIIFGRDPRDVKRDAAVIEAVPGRCSDLVDGLVDPDRWYITRGPKPVADFHAGQRSDEPGTPLLDDVDIEQLVQSVNDIEANFGWHPDIEWTGRKETLSFVQARPITTGAADHSEDERRWYLSLRPGQRKLAQLCERVSEQLIPELQAEGERLASVTLEELNDRDLAGEIKNRLAGVRKWKEVYYNDFIPFAHGVRQLGTYYNDAVKPDDPYEFLVLLRGEQMLAAQRNATLIHLAQLVADDHTLRKTLQRILADSANMPPQWQDLQSQLQPCDNGPAFLSEFDRLLSGYMDVSYKAERLHEHPEIFLHVILEQANRSASGEESASLDPSQNVSVDDCERVLFDALPEHRHDEAREVIRIARISWRLRDDDNLLVG